MSYLKIFWLVVKNLPALYRLVKQIEEMNANYSKSRKDKENEKVSNEAENAKTPEEHQSAANGAASRWGRQ